MDTIAQMISQIKSHQDEEKQKQAEIQTYTPRHWYANYGIWISLAVVVLSVSVLIASLIKRDEKAHKTIHDQLTSFTGSSPVASGGQ